VEGDFDRLWNLIAAGAADGELIEEWRRLLCQLRTLARLLDRADGDRDIELLRELSAISLLASRSATAARLALDDDLFANFVTLTGSVPVAPT
jgi:hypothetical protein